MAKGDIISMYHFVSWIQVSLISVIYYLLCIIYYLKKTGVFTMSRNSILLDKTLHFSARIIKLCRYLSEKKRESIIAKQIFRSATSIGANANEAIYAVSRADFVSKLHISLKETAETEYWLRLLMLSESISEKEGESLLSDCLEIKRILVATLNKVKTDIDLDNR